MIYSTSIQTLQDSLQDWRKHQESIAFVPTMGNLHAGHIELIKIAKTKAKRVVVSIFVNPLQFGELDDFTRYPRTLEEDSQILEALDADLLFHPTAKDIYPEKAQTLVTVHNLANKYCGVARPGHFDGVATIVCKLFNLITPTIAVFGCKDFQQLTLIKIMVRDLHLPIEILGVTTIRDAHGLALSSRNSYLTEHETKQARLLYQTLRHAKEKVMTHHTDFTKIEEAALDNLTAAGFAPEYFTICRSNDLEPAQLIDNEIVILTAARLGKTRLIDNIAFSKPV